MLKKCLKYDLQSVARIWWVVAVAMTGAALVAGIALRLFLQSTADPHSSEAAVVFTSFGMLAAVLCIFGMIAGVTVSIILVYWRTYSHFYTDEGYLTFTLPVKRSTLYLSKVLTAAIVETATVLVLLLGVGLILLIAPPTTGGGIINPVVYKSLGEFIAMAWQEVGAWLIVWVVAFLPILFATQLYSCGLVFLCLTVGAVVAKKHKLLAAIGIYCLVSTVISFVSQFATMFLSSGVLDIIVAAIEASLTVAGLTVTAVLLIATLVVGCLATVIHFITVNLLEKKLNLA